MLRSECAVLGDPIPMLVQGFAQVLREGEKDVPVLRIMRLLERIAYTGMARCKYPVALASGTRWIQLQLHQLIHVLQHHHVAVELDNPVILFQREWRQFTPAIIEARVISEVLVDRR